MTADKKSKNYNIIVTTGGTGGHVFPALATAKELSKKGYDVTFVTDKRGKKYLENDAGDVKVKIANCVSPSGNLLHKIKALFKISFSMLVGLFLVLSIKPRLVIGFGSYASFPCLVAARILGIKIMLHEQNSVLGKVNRYFKKSASLVATSFEKTKYTDQVFVTGNPIREAIAPQEYLPDSEKFSIFITGGSQGAKVFNKIFPQAFLDLDKKLKVVHQVPLSELEITKMKYREYGIEAELKPFFNDMQRRISEAHLVICRAGSSTIFELAEVRRPALFIPLAIAANDHQKLNAEFVQEKGGGWILEEKDLSVEKAKKLMSELIPDYKKLKKAAKDVGKIARPAAAHTLSEIAHKIIVGEMAGERA